jgi:hypothetical protein
MQLASKLKSPIVSALRGGEHTQHGNPYDVGLTGLIGFSSGCRAIMDQFRAIGRGDDSRELAIHLFSALQGISVLAHGSREPELVVIETRRLRDWIRAL